MAIQGKRLGYFEEREGGETGKVIREWDTFTCGHCSRVVHVPHGFELGDHDVGAFCLSCMAPICCRCNKIMEATRKCDPFQKKLDRAYARRRLFEAMGL